jgi:hypothetical protein
MRQRARFGVGRDSGVVRVGAASQMMLLAIFEELLLDVPFSVCKEIVVSYAHTQQRRRPIHSVK